MRNRNGQCASRVQLAGPQPLQDSTSSVQLQWCMSFRTSWPTVLRQQIRQTWLVGNNTILVRSILAIALLCSSGTAKAGDNWGAIAYNPTNLDFGTAINYATLQEAKMVAMQYCVGLHNSPHCQIIGVFRNDCAALAIGPGGAGYTAYPNLRVAERKALEECRLHGGGACRIEATVCNDHSDADTRPSLRKSLGDSLMRGWEQRRRACAQGEKSQCR